MHLSRYWSVVFSALALAAPLHAFADDLPPAQAPVTAVVAAASAPAATEAAATAAALSTADAQPAPVAATGPAVVLSNETVQQPAGPAGHPDQAIAGGEMASDTRGQAERGDAAAQYLLGRTLQDEQQHEAARLWFERAAAQDHAAAVHQLAQLYEQGQGGPKDEHKGFELSLRAAELGWPEAMWDVASRYGAGRVAPRDLLAACTWILRARDHSGGENSSVAEQAREVLPYLERALSLEQLAICRKQASVWPPSAAAALPVARLAAALPSGRAQAKSKRGTRTHVAKSGPRVRATNVSRRRAAAR